MPLSRGPGGDGWLDAGGESEAGGGGRYDSPGGGGAWSRAGTLLDQMRAAGCTEWALVTATLLRRSDVLREIIDGECARATTLFFSFVPSLQKTKQTKTQTATGFPFTPKQCSHEVRRREVHTDSRLETAECRS